VFLKRTKFSELGRGNTLEAVGGGAEQVVQPVAVEDWDASAALFEGFAHVLREEVIAVILMGYS